MRRRVYEAPTGERDVDAAERVWSLKIYGWATAGGGMIGLVAGLSLGHPILGFFLGTGVVVGGVRLVLAVAARGASTLYNPSGATTPHKREFSYALSLVKRERYEDAVAVMESHIAEDVCDSEPYILLARTLRRTMKRPEEAVDVLRRALRDANLNSGQELLVRREVVEILRDDLGWPEKTAPDLARMAASYEGRPEGEWAREELARVKRLIAENHEG